LFSGSEENALRLSVNKEVLEKNVYDAMTSRMQRMLTRRKTRMENDDMPSEEFTPKYKKPKILLIDLPEEVIERVRSAGFNASAGTFGSPYKVTKRDGYLPVIPKADLPNYSEQEIIFIDLTPPETLDNPVGEKLTSDGELDWWAKCSRGEIDPRPRVMSMVSDDFDRIFQHGGLFVIFAQPRLLQNLVFARVEDPYGLVEKTTIKYDNWSFLSILSRLNVEADYGKEIHMIDYDSDFQLFGLLRKLIGDFNYNATFPYLEKENWWVPILNNKYKRNVGGLIYQKDSLGRILILPQTSKKVEVVVALLQGVLQDTSPHLFPDVEGARWVERPEYELDSILEYKSKKEAVKQRAKLELEEIDRKIAEKREKLGFLHGILTKTGEDLVSDVKLALEFIGFDKIADVDEEIKSNGSSASKQEDLQIHDRTPKLLVEVKGISGYPKESDTSQVDKYVTRRMREWDVTNVRGVSIINHQRNLPALERDNVHVFSEAQVKDAEDRYITLISTWDLYLLIRGMMKWGWDPKAIQDLFYASGRMTRIPAIYKPLGKIEKRFPEKGVVGIEISENLCNGDRISYIIQEGYLEEDVSSIQVNNQDVDKAIPGQKVGIKTEYSDKLSEGMDVYKVFKEVT
jgi:hypothetical protein